MKPPFSASFFLFLTQTDWHRILHLEDRFSCCLNILLWIHFRCIKHNLLVLLYFLAAVVLGCHVMFTLFWSASSCVAVLYTLVWFWESECRLVILVKSFLHGCWAKTRLELVWVHPRQAIFNIRRCQMFSALHRPGLSAYISCWYLPALFTELRPKHLQMKVDKLGTFPHWCKALCAGRTSFCTIVSCFSDRESMCLPGLEIYVR